MSFYIKLFLFVTFSSILALFTTKQLVKSTDHLPETFTVNTPYLEREEDAAAQNIPKPDKRDIYTQSEVTQELEQEKADNLSKKLAERQKQRESDQSISQASVRRVSEADDEIYAEENEDAVADELEPLPNARAAADDSESRESSGSGGSNSNNKGEATRADSDDDMRETDANALEKDDTLAANEIEQPRVGNTRLDRDKVQTRKNIVQALDVAYAPPLDSDCSFPDDKVVQVGVDYRTSSFAIKGQSLTNIDQLVKLYRKCGGGKMIILQNSEGVKDTKETLIQLRKDEVKYYLLQRRVPQDDMIFSDNS